MSHGLVFQHFGSKKGLYLESVRLLLERFDAAVQPDPDLPPAQRLEGALQRVVSFAMDHPRGFRALMLPTSAEVRDVVEEGRRRGIARVAAGAGIDPGRGDVAILLRGWIGFVEAALIAANEHPHPPSREALVELIAAPVLQVTAAAR